MIFTGDFVVGSFDTNKMISLAVLLVLCLTFVGLGTTDASAWTPPTLAISGDKVTGSPGDTVNIQVKIMNSFSSDVQLTGVAMSIWWNGTPTAVPISGSMTLVANGETTLYGSFVIPQVANGSYPLFVTVTGKTSTDSSTSSYTLMGSYRVEQSVSGTNGVDGNDSNGNNSLLLIGMGAILIIVIVLAIVLVRHRKEKSQPPGSPPQN